MVINELVNYGEILSALKEKIKKAQQKAILAVNNEMLRVYWDIGKSISEQEELSGWGSKIIDKLASDLKVEFPNMKGLSPRNLRYMRDFSLAYPSFLQQAAAKIEEFENESIIIWQQLVAKLPWGHHQVLLTKLKTLEERKFYIEKSIENGWSRSVLEHHISSKLIQTQGTLVNNFKNAIPAYQSELAKQVFKDPYNFDFIMLGEKAKERDLENALLTQVTNVILELGEGFAFMSRQKRFEAGGREFFVDLLFYHTKLRRHIIIELKIGEFEPEYISKMNLYLGIADDQLRGEFDEPAIGLILCKTNNKIIAEYALRDTNKPIGIAEYKIAEKLPDEVQGELPSIEDIERRVDEEMNDSLPPINKRLNLIKEKIKNITNDEIQSSATFEILTNLYKYAVRPLYLELIKEIKNFEEDFYLQEFLWRSNNDTFNTLEALDEFWQTENKLMMANYFVFQVRLDGFKKSGTESFSIQNTIELSLSTYNYAITFNKNDNNPFLKKQYHQPLIKNEREQIIEVFMSSIMDDLDDFLNRLQNKKSIE